MAIQEGSSEYFFEGLTAYFAARCGAFRLPLDEDRIWGRGDGALLWPKFTGIAAWFNRECRHRCDTVRSCAVSTGLTRGSKGGAAIALTLDGSRICFLGCHLSAETTDGRAEDCATILEELSFQFATAGPVVEHFDSIVFFGDLNYRLAEKGEEGSLTVVQCEGIIASGNAQALWEHDKVANEISRGGHALTGFQEPRPLPNFFPTYKKKPDRPALPAVKDLAWVRGEYNTHYVEPWYKGGQTKLRMPSFTDRILVHRRADAQLALLPRVAHDFRGLDIGHRYGSLSCLAEWEGECRDLFGGSDHSPVAAEFELKEPAGAAEHKEQLRSSGIYLDGPHDGELG